MLGNDFRYWETSLYLTMLETREKNKMKIIGVDVDGVCANTHVPWLARYNRDYDDNLTYDQWTTWDIHTLVKPECGKKIYKYIEDPTLYDETPPVEGAVERINVLKWYFRIVYITTSTIGASGKKKHWLRKNGFLQDDDDYFECKDKSLIFSHYLIDDDIKNIQKPSPYGNRINIIMTRPWNKDFQWKYRMDTWHSSFNFE